MSIEHHLIALYTVDQIVLEMTYVNKGKNLTVNRRVSLNFRDSALYQIFKQTLIFNKTFTEQLQLHIDSSQEPPWVLLECLKVNLQVCQKCLVFDYTSVLLNETLDEPSTTNVSFLTDQIYVCLGSELMARVCAEQGDNRCPIFHFENKFLGKCNWFLDIRGCYIVPVRVCKYSSRNNWYYRSESCLRSKLRIEFNMASTISRKTHDSIERSFSIQRVRPYSSQVWGKS